MLTRILFGRSHFIFSWFDHSVLSSTKSLHTLTVQRLNGATEFLSISTNGIFQLHRGLKYVSRLSKRCPDCYYIREEDPRLPWPFRLKIYLYSLHSSIAFLLYPFLSMFKHTMFQRRGVRKENNYV